MLKGLVLLENPVVLASEDCTNVENVSANIALAFGFRSQDSTAEMDKVSRSPSTNKVSHLKYNFSFFHI